MEWRYMLKIVLFSETERGNGICRFCFYPVFDIIIKIVCAYKNETSGQKETGIRGVPYGQEV